MNPTELNDDELLRCLKNLVRQEREDTAAVVAHLAEVDNRNLARERAYPSLFEYCVKELGYSEPSAFHRIRAARAVRKRPELLDLLRRGEVHLRSLVLLHPHLDGEGALEIIQQARGKTVQEVSALVAPLCPRPAPRDAIRVIAVRPASVGDLPLFAAVAPGGLPAQSELKWEVSFGAGSRLRELLDRARALLCHRFPEGRFEDIFTAALEALLNLKDPNLWPEGRKTKSRTRKIPKWIRRRVWKRDHGRCAYKAPDGRRCASRRALEFDHVRPWALGGGSNDPSNVRLLCRAHNGLMAENHGLSRPATAGSR
ncbi:MAG: HNH endonuclease [Elusimicrobia bacterium]|nr:HNH endonuclease [Elusimicrobiota bacterium]